MCAISFNPAANLEVGLLMPFLQTRDPRLREVQELVKGHPAAKWKTNDSKGFCLLSKPSCVSLHRAAFQKRVHTSTSLCNAFCKTDRWTARRDAAQRLDCQGE